jgi:putative endonuclease
VIRSEATGKTYVGQTNDLAGRLRQHNDPEANRSLYTTKHRGPWVLAHAEEYASRRDAMARERFLKSGQGREWLQETLGSVSSRASQGRRAGGAEQIPR